MTENTLTVPARSAHNASLGDLVTVLQAQQRQGVDLVVPAHQLRMENGNLITTGMGASIEVTTEPTITLDGVTPGGVQRINVDGAYLPTAQVDGQLATLTDMPLRYVRRMRAEKVSLLDVNFNTWARELPSDKKVLVRLLAGQTPGLETSGIARAVLSDRYGIRDNLDTVLACLDGMRAAGLGATNIRGADLSDDKLYLRIDAPELAIAEPEWMKLYRSPFQGSGHGGETAERPRLVHCGLLIKNSETGNGRFEIVPELRFQVCDNGAQCPWDAVKKVHLGAKLDEGQIVWSQATRRAAKDLMREQVKDAVQAFMSEDYMVGALDKFGEAAGIKVADAAEVIQVVGKQMSYNEGETALLLDHFIRGGLLTTGGVFHAVTSAAQDITDVDRSNDFAGTGFAAMIAAAKVAA